MPPRKNLTGQVFHKLTVREPTDQRNSGGSVLWLCQCECGNFTLASSTELQNNHKKSCGCLQKESASKIGQANLIDLTGQTFNELTIIKKVSSKKTPAGATKVFWLCKCSCGNNCIVEGNALKSGNTKSCGCIKSFGEQKITALLQEYGIPFIREKIFDPNTGYRYDFYVNDRYVIEYDGKQHFQDSSWGNLKESQQRDDVKNQYCFNHSIPIIRIPYTHFNHITIEDLLIDTSTFIINSNECKKTCDHCIYEMNCHDRMFRNVRCENYKRDPPDGGYYGCKEEVK